MTKVLHAVKWKLLSHVQLFATSELYSPWNSPGQNTEVGSLSLLQGIFPTQGLNPGLLHCRQIHYQLSHNGSPGFIQTDNYFPNTSWCFENVLFSITWCNTETLNISDFIRIYVYFSPGYMFYRSCFPGSILCSLSETQANGDLPLTYALWSLWQEEGKVASYTLAIP